MTVGISDFDVADVGSVVAPLARNVDNSDALWRCGGWARDGSRGQHEEQFYAVSLHRVLERLTRKR
jgi:hypothetical protein